MYSSESTGTICDEHGIELPPGTSPSPQKQKARDDWFPYRNRVQFEVADFLYRRNQMSARDINFLLNIWEATLVTHGEEPPFRNCADLYATIDATVVGDTPWQSATLNYNGQRPEGPVPSWMESEHQIWYRDPRTLIHNLISNPDFKDEFDYTPFHEYVDGKHCFQDFMSGDWAWKQAVSICFLLRVLSKTFYRMKLAKILPLTVQCLFPLSSEATKQQSLSQQGIMSIGRYTYQSVIFVTLHDALIETGLYSSVSMRSQKVIFT